MTVTDELLQNNRRYVERFDQADLPKPPSRKVAVVACMDARLNPYAVLGLREGEAHVIRNAGGVVTDDVLRSLVISQRLLGTREVILIHHSDCGMVSFRDQELKDQLEAEIGMRPSFSFESFTDLEQDVRQSMARIEVSPFVPHKDRIRGFVLDLATGRLEEVDREGPAPVV